MDFSFLKSNRFWVMIGGCIVVASQDGFSWASIMKALEAFVAGFIAVRTVDRFSETLKK